MKVKEETEKAVLKLSIKKTKIMTSGSIASWQIKGEKVEAVTYYILGGYKIPADGIKSYGIKKTLAPWKESYNKPRQRIKKQRHYFVNKGPSGQSVLPLAIILY